MNHRPISELRKQVSPDRLARIDKGVREELEQMLLSELRRVAGRTQADVAQAMGVQQPHVSRLEVQDDMQVSTLRQLVEALGGELEIIARLPGRSVALSQFRR